MDSCGAGQECKASVTLGCGAWPQGFEAHVLMGGQKTLLERRIPFIHSEVGPAMMAGAGSNATAFLEHFAQVRPSVLCRIAFGLPLCMPVRHCLAAGKTENTVVIVSVKEL